MTNQCNCRGNPPQTPAHLILWCPIHQRARQRMRTLTPKIPRLRLQLLLYTNMGADALGSYLTTTRVATRRWKLGLDRQQTTQETRRQKRMIGWGTLEDAHDEHQGGEIGDEAEERNEAEEGRSERREGVSFGD